jgi:hypothetical protein
MVHSGSSSLHTILEDYDDEGDTTLGGRGSSDTPAPRGCNVVTLVVPIADTLLPEDILVHLTILTVPCGPPHCNQVPDSFLRNNKLIRRSNKHEPALGRLTSSAGPCNGKASSPVSEQQLKPS